MSDHTSKKKPSLLLHVCCAPCATHAVEILRDDFEVTGYFYGPNIHPAEEYERRLESLDRLSRATGLTYTSGPYEMDTWIAKTEGFESEPEGGRRCTLCFEIRLDRTAREARDRGFPMFATTLSVSPHKDAHRINSIGDHLAHAYRVGYHQADFKKQNGFRRSVELSSRHGLYRQRRCGCRYSLPVKRSGKGKKGDP